MDKIGVKINYVYVKDGEQNYEYINRVCMCIYTKEEFSKLKYIFDVLLVPDKCDKITYYEEAEDIDFIIKAIKFLDIIIVTDIFIVLDELGFIHKTCIECKNSCVMLNKGYSYDRDCKIKHDIPYMFLCDACHENNMAKVVYDFYNEDNPKICEKINYVSMCKYCIKALITNSKDPYVVCDSCRCVVVTYINHPRQKLVNQPHVCKNDIVKMDEDKFNALKDFLNSN